MNTILLYLTDTGHQEDLDKAVKMSIILDNKRTSCPK